MCCCCYNSTANELLWLQGSWTEVKKYSIAHCSSVSKHPTGMTVGTKTSAAAGWLKDLNPLCRTPSFFLTRKQMYARFCIQVSKSLPICRAAAGDPPHSKIIVPMLGCTMCLHHKHFAGTHMLDKCIHRFGPANRDLL